MMGRWFNLTVVAFWLATMSWLVSEKVLPSLLVGDPPNYRAILREPESRNRLVGWRIYLDDQPLGWATGCTERMHDGMCEVRNRIHLRNLPVVAIAPTWVASLLKAVDRSTGTGDMKISVDASGSLNIDPFGRPVDFLSRATIGSASDGMSVKLPFFSINVHGSVSGNQMQIVAKTGDLTYQTRSFVPVNSLVGDAFSPQARLPNLRIGQAWTVPVYSAFRPPHASPMEVLQASVEVDEPIVWERRLMTCRVVVLRNAPGADLSSGRAVRGRMWVASDGLVVKQELNLFESRMTFVRVADEPIVEDKVRPDLEPWWPAAQ